MKKIKLKKSTFVAIGLSLFVVSSCVDKDFDFRNYIDTTMQIGEEVALPIGYSSTVRLNEILSLDNSNNLDTVKLGEDLSLFGLATGDYYFFAKSKEGDENIFEVDEIEFDLNRDMKGSTVSLTFPTGTYEVPLKNVTLDFQSTSDDISYTVRDLKSFTPTENLDIMVYLDLDDGVQATLKDLRFAIPQEFLLAESEDYTIEPGNVAKFGEVAIGYGGLDVLHIYIKEVKCPSGSFTPAEDIYDTGCLDIDTKVTVTGTVKVSSTGISTLNITFTPMPDASLEMKVVEGTFVNKNDETRIFKINSLPELLKNEATKVYVDRLIANLSVKNTTTPPLDVLEMNKISVASIYDDRTIDVDIDKLNIYPSAEKKTFDITIVDRKYDTDKFTVVPKITSLIDGKIPEAVEVNIAETKLQGTIHAGHQYKFSYDMRVPLAFKEGTQIVFNDTLSGWLESLEDVDFIRNAETTVELHADITSTMPFDAVIDKDHIIALDEWGDPITDKKKIEVVLEKGETIKAFSNTKAVFYIKSQNLEELLDELDGIALTFTMAVGKEGEGHVVNNNKHAITFNKISAIASKLVYEP
ncbi:MAG: hypothetical protein HUK03_07175 [Bacteroidaceae bacterium]|nr:hypothetical protein [Bacteroidaceae bacterium]